MTATPDKLPPKKLDATQMIGSQTAASQIPKDLAEQNVNGCKIGDLLSGKADVNLAVNQQASMQDLSKLADSLGIDNNIDVFTASKKDSTPKSDSKSSSSSDKTSSRQHEEKAKEKLINKIKSAIAVFMTYRGGVDIAGKGSAQTAEDGKMNSVVKTPEEWAEYKAKLSGKEVEEQKGVEVRYTSYADDTHKVFPKDDMASWPTDKITEAFASGEMNWTYDDLKLLLTENENFTDAQFEELLHRLNISQGQFDELWAMDLTDSQRKILERYHVYPDGFPSDCEDGLGWGDGALDFGALGEALGALLGGSGGGGCDGGGGCNGGGGCDGGGYNGDFDENGFDDEDMFDQRVQNVSETINELLNDKGVNLSSDDREKLQGLATNAKEQETAITDADKGIQKADETAKAEQEKADSAQKEIENAKDDQSRAMKEFQKAQEDVVAADKEYQQKSEALSAAQEKEATTNKELGAAEQGVAQAQAMLETIKSQPAGDGENEAKQQAVNQAEQLVKQSESKRDAAKTAHDNAEKDVERAKAEKETAKRKQEEARKARNEKQRALGEAEAKIKDATGNYDKAIGDRDKALDEKTTQGETKQKAVGDLNNIENKAQDIAKKYTKDLMNSMLARYMQIANLNI